MVTRNARTSFDAGISCSALAASTVASACTGWRQRRCSCASRTSSTPPTSSVRAHACNTVGCCQSNVPWGATPSNVSWLQTVLLRVSNKFHSTYIDGERAGVGAGSIRGRCMIRVNNVACLPVLKSPTGLRPAQLHFSVKLMTAF